MSVSQNVNVTQHSATMRLAYHLWEEAGRPFGRDQEFWNRAEEKLAGEGTHSPTMPSEPADPHPSDEGRSNVYNSSPGGDTASEQKDRRTDRLGEKFPGSTA